MGLAKSTAEVTLKVVMPYAIAGGAVLGISAWALHKLKTSPEWDEWKALFTGEKPSTEYLGWATLLRFLAGEEIETGEQRSAEAREVARKWAEEQALSQVKDKATREKWTTEEKEKKGLASSIDSIIRDTLHYNTHWSVEPKASIEYARAELLAVQEIARKLPQWLKDGITRCENNINWFEVKATLLSIPTLGIKLWKAAKEHDPATYKTFWLNDEEGRKLFSLITSTQKRIMSDNKWKAERMWDIKTGLPIYK